MSTEQSTYRVRSTLTIGNKTNAPQTIWEGDDLEALSMEYPPSEIWGADPLGHSEIDGGHFRTGYTFEQFVNGAWQEIRDPRVRLTPMTDTEREIDFENRRDNPGDFIDDDDDDIQRRENSGFYDTDGDDGDDGFGYDDVEADES